MFIIENLENIKGTKKISLLSHQYFPFQVVFLYIFKLNCSLQFDNLSHHLKTYCG